MSITKLRLAVCLFPDVTALDFIGPVEALAFLHPTKIEQARSKLPEIPAYSIEATFLSYTLDPIRPTALGPNFLANSTYDQEHEQFDILLVPGGNPSISRFISNLDRTDWCQFEGPGARPHNVQPSITAFIKTQAPKAKYILSVCTGAWIIANAGLLDGKNATTNKAAFTSCKVRFDINENKFY